MTSTVPDPNSQCAGVVSVNVRAFMDVDHADIKVLYVNMKDEDPQYDPDAINKQ
jgi:hypothetical protein